RELRLVGEERLELRTQHVVVEDRRGPAATGAEHIAIEESATDGKAAKISQLHSAAGEIGHVHVDRLETGARERGGHLDLAVDTLLAQNRHARPRALGD